ncbi:MBL fold metallo-hydrolase [Sorangium sp. So ce367]|uniref:MBL fold metallo-hydrolase n=1 Tax=Sorangium sp. So ce367 TaxID=3133305 RepID=UPI003F6363F7
MKSLHALPAVLLLGCGFPFTSTARNLSALTATSSPAPVRSLPETSAAGVSVLWVGHATVLIRMGERYVLTDSVFSHTVGMLSPRLVEPGMPVNEVPKLTATLVSHPHFDHLSFSSLDALGERTGTLLVPPGILDYLPRFPFQERGLGTWSSIVLDAVKITAVPLLHPGGRYGLDESSCDDCATGFVLEHNGWTIYFGGDTAYSPTHFEETHRRFPRIDLAILPICPIAPRDFMRKTHMDPGEALRAYRILGARWMMPIHFDTFINSDDVRGDCLNELHASMDQLGISSDAVVELKIGERRVLLERIVPRDK